MSKYDGGPAFPATQYYDEKPVGIHEGATLRDYFAAKALPAVLAYESTGTDGQFTNLYSADQVAQMAYHLADAMLKERQK